MSGKYLSAIDGEGSKPPGGIGEGGIVVRQTARCPSRLVENSHLGVGHGQGSRQVGGR